VGEWERRSFGDLAELLPGKYLPKEEYGATGPYPVFGSNTVMGRGTKKLYDGPLIAMARIGSNFGAVMWSSSAAWINNNASAVRARPGADTRYLYYWLCAFDFEAIRRGSGQPFVAHEDLAAQELRAPSEEEQRAIAGVLGALDDKIESNRRLITTSEAILDAEADLMAGARRPLGEIVQVMRDVVDPLKLGGVEVDHFSIPAFDAGQRPERSTAAAIKSGKSRVDGPTVLLSRLNPRFPRLWHAVPEPDIPALCSTEFMVLRPAPTLMLADVWLSCCQPRFRQEMVQRATGTSGSHQRVRPNDVLAMEVVDPLNLGDETRTEAAELLDLAEAARRENTSLAALRDALLPVFLSGRLRVKDVQKVAEEVM